MNNRFFKDGNRLFIANWDRKAADYINNTEHKAMTKIHLFLYNTNYSDSEAKSLIAICNNCKRNKIKFIVHCLDGEVRRTMSIFRRNNKINFILPRKTLFDGNIKFSVGKYIYCFNNGGSYIAEKESDIIQLNRYK